MKKIKNNWARYVLQFGLIGVVAAFILKVFFGSEPADPEAYCPFGGLQALLTYLNSNTLACSMSIVQIMMGITLAVGVILFSKLFCGYLCPLGTVTEWMGELRKKLNIKITLETGCITDKVLRSIKYILLFWIFYMTITSSELFCKNFDPYYAIATGFKGELTVWMAAISICCLFLGNLFVNMFWCKYICPLGAISNIFKFAITFIALVVLAIILGKFGMPLSWVWMLGVACVLSYIFEIVYYKSKIFPLLRITKDEEKCNSCGMCSKKCPQQINVSDLRVVKHIDCTLCGECIGSCNKGALQVAGKPAFRWLPAVLTVVLVIVGIWMGTHWELATIDEYWGDTAKHEHLETLEKGGMRTVKCYGSSKAFAAKMKSIPGVYGVTTYVKRFTVEIHYDPKETTKEKIEAVMFTPTKRKLQDVPAEVAQLKIITIGVDGLFDRMDMVYLGNMIREKEGYYGIESEYDCPVKVKLYVDINKNINKDELEDIVEMREYEMPVHGGGTKKVECEFNLKYINEQVDTIGRLEFLANMFPSMTMEYKQNLSKHSENVEKAVYELPYPGLDKPMIQRQLPYLSSMLSNNTNLLAFETTLNKDMSVIRLTYAKGTMTDDQIWEALNVAKWTVHFKDGSVKEMDPTIKFENKGATMNEITPKQ